MFQAVYDAQIFVSFNMFALTWVFQAMVGTQTLILGCYIIPWLA